MTSTSTTGVSDVLDEAAKMAQVYGAYVGAYVVLGAALVVILRRPEAELRLQIPEWQNTYHSANGHHQAADSSGCRLPFPIGDRGEASAHGVLRNRSR